MSLHFCRRYHVGLLAAIALNSVVVAGPKMTVRISYDDGKTWPVAKVLHSSAAAYSCLAVLPDKSIGCLYERGHTNAYEKITFARATLSWLEER